jgi:putative FmdB family regulatory protein
MPIYTYRCSSCGVQFERQQSFTDQSLIRCPECGKKALKKVYLPVGIVFKGSGFYATDHHSPSGQQVTKMDDRPEEKKDSKGSGESKELTKGDKTTGTGSEKSAEKKD